jgi:hypothetical protein
VSGLRQPRLVVHVPVESPALAFDECASFEDERRLAHELGLRDLLAEIDEALATLLVALDDRLEDEAA